MTQVNTHKAVELATQYINSRLSNKITMADLKTFTGYSERSLQLLFQKYFSKTPFEYIEEQRLMLAYDLIKSHKKN